MLLAGLGLLVTGCAEKQQRQVVDRPRTNWPTQVTRPQASTISLPPTTPSPAASTSTAPTLPPAPAANPSLASTPAAIALNAMPRSSWAAKPPIVGRINPMNNVTRITCHHEGWTPVWFSDMLSTRDRLETIRASHIQRLQAGDIGYHFIIDRAGRIWEGRPLIYQGAHVRNQNENNIGIMMLGNFDKQSPTTVQLNSLERAIAYLRKQYRVPVGRVYTHQELNPTACPGRNLQPRITSMRTNGMV